MSGGRGTQVFLSAHRCPEVDLLPPHHSTEQLPPPCSQAPAEKNLGFTCTGEADYLDICSSHPSEEEEEEEEEDNLSDWSEEDLSLHFSPAVIQQSDDESDPDSSFECLEITMATQGSGQEGAPPKMVPKRQIQLKKKNIEVQGSKVRHGPAEEGCDNSGISVNEVLRLTPLPRSDLLLRQHSMPASLNMHVKGSSDVIDYGAYKGLVAGTNQGILPEYRRLQKSLSLDETKTKMASSLLKNVLWKKMHVERNTTTQLRRSPVGGTGGGGAPAPVHLEKDASSQSVSMTTKTSSQLFGQKESPPPTYQQAVAVRGHVRRVTASLGQSHVRKHNNTFTHPITEQRRGREPMTGGENGDGDGDGARPRPATLSGPRPSPAVTRPPAGLSQSKSAMPRLPVFFQPRPPPAPGGQPLFCAQEQSATLGVDPCQQVPPHHFHPPAAPQTLLTKVSCARGLAQPQRLDPILHLAGGSEQVPARLARTVSGTPDHNRTEGDQGGRGAPTQELQQQPHPFPCNIQGFQPALAGGHFVDLTGAGAARGGPGGPFTYLRFDPERTPPLQRKMLLDPETGQFIQVVLPAASSSSNTSVYPLLCANPTPNMLSPAPVVLQGGGANHPMLSVMHLQPLLSVPSLYPVHCLPLTMMTSRLPHCDDITSPCVACDRGKRNPI